MVKLTKAGVCPPLENKVEARVCKWVKAQGGKAIKFTPKGDVGWPDRIMILPPHGTHVWVEVKRPGQPLRELQVYRIKELQAIGANVIWGDDAEELIDLLKEYM